MSAPADLLAMLNAGAPGGPHSGNRRNEPKSILSFKAGKMNAEVQPNGKYLVSPDPRRGEIHVLWQSQPASSGGGTAAAANAAGHVQFEWRDRRTRTAVDSLTVFPDDDVTFQRVDTGREHDRVYILQFGTSGNRRFFWMQDKTDENDDDRCVKVNLYLTNAEDAASAAREGADGATAAAAPAAGGIDVSSLANAAAPAGGSAPGGALDSNALLQIMQGLGGRGGAEDGARTTTVPGGSSGGIPTAGAGQVDALSNILENLGMPHPTAPGFEAAAGNRPSRATGESGGEEGEAGSGEGSSGGAGSAGGGNLTLADLQGAMAGLATASPTSSASAPGPSLSELASSDAITESGILDDDAAKARLMELLPEGQQTDELLRENLRSPQVAQCLKSLTAALCGEGGGGPSEFNSILANFQLKPEDGAGALASGNPIQAFLDCVLKQVEREKADKPKEESKGGEEKEGEGKKPDGSDKDASGGDGDATMEYSA